MLGKSYRDDPRYGWQGEYRRDDPLPDPRDQDPVAPLKTTTGTEDNFL